LTMISMQTPTPFQGSVAAYAGCVSIAPSDPSWCLFTHERYIYGWEQWLVMLGLFETDDIDPTRQGTFTITHYCSTAGYMYRLVKGITGKSENFVCYLSRFL